MRQTNACWALGLVFAAAAPVLAQDNFSLCDVNRDHAVNVLDVQAMNHQGLGLLSPANDLAGVGAVGVVDVQTEINVILFGCQFYSPTPRFAITNVTLMNQAWNPSNIPSAGDLSVHAALVRPTTLMNQAWISADIPSPGNLTSNAVNSKPVSLVNQAWISADIPSPGNARFAAGLLVSVNNNSAGRSVPSPTDFAARVVAGGSSTAPVDLASVNDGDALIGGQTVRFRVFPPEEALAGSDFLIDGAPMRVHTPFEVLVTAPASGSGFDLQAIVYRRDGREWRTPLKHLLIAADPGQTLTGRAVRADHTAASTGIGVRANGLAAEYFRAEPVPVVWSDLNRQADKRGFITAINQPDSIAYGADPFGTGFASSYATRFRGEILVTTDGAHRFFLDAPLGARLVVDGKALIDTPPASFSPELQAEMDLTAGWHAIEVDSYQTAGRANLQLSWQQPNSIREIVRPEALASESGALAAADSDGSFRVESFPLILNPLAWHAVPADSHIQVILDQSIAEERSVRQ